MRFFTRSALLLAALLPASCSPDDMPGPDFANGSYAGQGRNRLCIAGEGGAKRAGFIIYGDGDANCSASGRIEGAALVPRGEGECRIALDPVAGGVRLGAVPAACAYYCAPGVASAGETFVKLPATAPVSDLAGDALC